MSGASTIPIADSLAAALERIENERTALGLVSWWSAVWSRKPYRADGVLVIHEDDGSVIVATTLYGERTERRS